jgi:origin recognition complex subunit 6
LDWFENIAEGSGLALKDASGQVGSNAALDTEDGAGGESKGPRHRGLGTMMQDRVDYLSDKKRAEYKVWKQGILVRMEDMEKEIAQGAMETSEG